MQSAPTEPIACCNPPYRRHLVGIDGAGARRLRAYAGANEAIASAEEER
jgi:hypothetical protein